MGELLSGWLDELFLCLLFVVDGGVEGCDDVVEGFEGGVFVVVGTGLVVELVGDHGEAVDGFAVGAECLACPVGGGIDVSGAEGDDGEGESGFGGAHGASVGAVWALG